MTNKQFTNGMKYSVVGRYMQGSEVTGYHLVGEDGVTQHKVTKDQLILLIDRGIILNCRMQMLQGKPLLRGKGINIGELPVFDEKTGQIKRMENAPTVRTKGNTAATLGQIHIIGRITKGVSVVGYVTRDNGGIERNMSRDKVIELAAQKMIANATVQKYNGKYLLRGAGVSLEELPSIPYEALKK